MIYLFLSLFMAISAFATATKADQVFFSPTDDGQPLWQVKRVTFTLPSGAKEHYDVHGCVTAVTMQKDIAPVALENIADNPSKDYDGYFATSGIINATSGIINKGNNTLPAAAVITESQRMLWDVSRIGGSLPCIPSLNVSECLVKSMDFKMTIKKRYPNTLFYQVRFDIYSDAIFAIIKR